MKSSQDISSQMRSQLKILDPDFSAEPNTPERKIIDTVAEVIASSQADQYTLQYQFDVDSKVGADLDKFIALFGFARQTGVRATGIVTFYLNSAASQDIYIPIGTQVSTSASSITSATVFTTTSSAVIYAGATSASATVQAVNIGSQGNVVANSINTYLGSQATQIAYCNNDLATSNGRDSETDDELRVRFKNTVLRNIAGTKDQFLSIALSSQYTNKAIILGAEDTYREGLQFGNVVTSGPGSGTSFAISQIPYSKYTFNFDYYVTQNTTGTDVFFNPTTDYTFIPTYSGTVIGAATGTVRPAVTLSPTQRNSTLNVGENIILQHTYNSINSRNNPTSNILNYIDVYVDGENSVAVSESTILPPISGTNSQILTTSSGSKYFIGNFRLKKTRATPPTGLLYQKLIWQPITLLPDSISIGNTLYYQDTDFYVLEDITTNRGSKLGADGIAWNQTAYAQITALPTSSGIYSTSYEFNSLPLTLNQMMNQYKQITTDVLVHAGNKRYFTINLTIMYVSGYNTSSVNSNIATALSNYLAGLDFGATISISDIVQVAHDINGVDNVRLSTSNDGGPYGIVEYGPDGVTQINLYTNDFILNDIDTPVLQGINTTQKAQNTWTSG